MGLLDDAIREHLELKRRRGADPTELERQEHEALRPARQREFAKPEGEAPTTDATRASAEQKTRWFLMVYLRQKFAKSPVSKPL